jgi:hypothetical protein
VSPVKLFSGGGGGEEPTHTTARKSGPQYIIQHSLATCFMLFLFTPQQCCGSASNKNQDPDPHQSDKLDPEPDQDPHQFADDKPKWME